MIIGITRELVAGENRVSLCPDNVQSLVEKGLELLIEQNAGAQAGFSDDDYISVGALTHSVHNMDLSLKAT